MLMLFKIDIGKPINAVGAASSVSSWTASESCKQPRRTLPNGQASNDERSRACNIRMRRAMSLKLSSYPAVTMNKADTLMHPLDDQDDDRTIYFIQY